MKQERIETAIAKKVNPQGLVVLTPVEQILKGALAIQQGSELGKDEKRALAHRIAEKRSIVWDALAAASTSAVMSEKRPMIVSHHEQDITRDFPGTVAFYNDSRMDLVLAEAVGRGEIQQEAVDILGSRLIGELGLLEYIPDEVGGPKKRKIEIALRHMIIDSSGAVSTVNQFAFVVASHQVMGTLSDQLAEAGDPDVSLTERKRLNQVTQNLLRTRRAVTLDPEVLTEEMEKRGLGDENYQGRMKELQVLSYIISVLDAEGSPGQKTMLDGLKKGMQDAVERLIINYPEKARNVARRFGVPGVKRESWTVMPGERTH